MAENINLGQQVLNMLNEGTGREQIESILLEKGHDERFVKDLVQETVKLRHARQRSQGLTLILSGAVVCFLSFLLTITSSFSHSSFPMILYGLTSVGIIIVFAGFMKVF
jgi:hypothetical protein